MRGGLGDGGGGPGGGGGEGGSGRGELGEGSGGSGGAGQPAERTLQASVYGAALYGAPDPLKPVGARQAGGLAKQLSPQVNTVQLFVQKTAAMSVNKLLFNHLHGCGVFISGSQCNMHTYQALNA